MASVECRIPNKNPKTIAAPTSNPIASANIKSWQSMISFSKNPFGGCVVDGGIVVNAGAGAGGDGDGNSVLWGWSVVALL